jgi:hypothetical protein
MTQPLYINREDAKQHLIDEARRAWKAAGTQSLTYADLMTHSDGVTKHAVVHYVGGINELLRLAEIPPHRMHRGRLTEDDVFDAMRKCFIQVGGVTTQAALTRHFDHITFCKDRWHNWHGILLAFSGWLKDSAISFPYYSELESQIARLAPKTTNV